MSVGQGHRCRKTALVAVAVALFAGPGVSACRRGPALAQTGSGAVNGAEAAILDGRERVEWHQPGTSLEEVQAFRYMAVVGQMPRDVADVRCEAKSPKGPFVCSGKLPSIPRGVHELRLIAVAKDGPKNLISRWSIPVLVEKR